MNKVVIKESNGYTITKKGEVYNKDNRRMSTVVNQSGYEQLGIRMLNGTRKWFVVHRLVASHFIDNPEDKPHVNHIDGNKLNNHVSNLEWCTPKENMLHAVNVLGKGVGNNNANRIISEEDAHVICKLMQVGHTNYEIAEALNLTLGIVTSIRSKNSWKRISDLYKIPKKSRVISEITARWLCEQIASGKSTKEILSLTTNPKITRYVIYDMKRRGLYSDISKDYF